MILTLLTIIQDSKEAASTLSSKVSTGELLTIIGLVTSAFISIAFLIYRTGSIVNTVGTLEKGFEKLSDRFDSLQQSLITNSNSPRVLNKKGLQILEQSKITSLLEPFYDKFLKEIKGINPKNGYRAEQILIDLVRDFNYPEDTQLAIEDGAFNSGSEVKLVLFVGTMKIRDEILSKLGFHVSDIDDGNPDIETPSK